MLELERRSTTEKLLELVLKFQLLGHQLPNSLKVIFLQIYICFLSFFASMLNITIYSLNALDSVYKEVELRFSNRIRNLKFMKNSWERNIVAVAKWTKNRFECMWWRNRKLGRILNPTLDLETLTAAKRYVFAKISSLWQHLFPSLMSCSSVIWTETDTAEVFPAVVC